SAIAAVVLRSMARRPPTPPPFPYTPLFRSRAGRKRLVRARLGTEGDRDAVPAIDGDDGPGEAHQLLVREVPPDCAMNVVGDVAFRDVGDGLGPLEGGTFPVCVVRRFAPGVQAVE